MTLSTSAVAVCCCSDFLEIACARLYLLEQPRILDRDHGLVGKSPDESELLFRKLEASLQVGKDDRADALVLLDQRHERGGLKTAGGGGFASKFGRIRSRDIGNFDNPPLQQSARGWSALGIERDRINRLRPFNIEVRQRCRVCIPVQLAVLQRCNGDAARLEKPCRAAHDGTKRGLDIRF
jgi:hypothetical protein